MTGIKACVAALSLGAYGLVAGNESNPPLGGSPTCFLFRSADAGNLIPIRKKLGKRLAEMGGRQVGAPEFASPHPGNTENLKENSWYHFPETKDADIYLNVLVRGEQIVCKVWWQVDLDLETNSMKGDSISRERIWTIYTEVTSRALELLEWSDSLKEKNVTNRRLRNDIRTNLKRHRGRISNHQENL